MPQGYYFRSRYFRKLDALINDFKRQPVPDTRAAPANVDFNQQLQAVSACLCLANIVRLA